MSLDRLALPQVARPAKPRANEAEPRRESIAASALAFVRHNAASWRGFRLLERSLLEGALALARKGRGQTLFVAMHGPRSFADKRLDTIEVKTIPNRPFGLARDVLRAAMARPEARSAVSALPAELLSYLKTPLETAPSDPIAWASAIADFVTAIPARAPMLIVVDHVHHADADSLRLIDALARRAAASRMVLVVTYRLDVTFNAELDTWVRELTEATLARSTVVASPQTDEARLLFETAFGRSTRLDGIPAALAGDEAGLLMHGLTAIEACRRAGRWADAKAIADRVYEAGDANKAPYVACSAAIALGHILADQGKWDECIERLEHIQLIVETTKEDDLIAWLYWGLARAYWGQADRRRGFQMLRLAQTVSEHVGDASLVASIGLCGIEWLADHRRVRAAQDWLESLAKMADQTSGLAVHAMYALASGSVSLAEGDAIGATGHLRAALRQWSVLGDEHAAARARLRLASALLARDDADSRRDGREELIDAHAAFTRLGAVSDVTATEELGAKHGIRPRARRVSNGSTSPGGITPREREVLGLIVRGMTNRQIAATLSITEKTAEGHVSNILAKLGVASRGQAAGFALANGLLETAEAS